MTRIDSWQYIDLRGYLKYVAPTRQAAAATPHQTIHSDHDAFSFRHFELKSFKHRVQESKWLRSSRSA